MTSVAAAAPAVAAIAWPPAPGIPELHPGDAVYLVGIRGAGMSGLARVLAARGLRVAGSDVAAGSDLAMLGGHGIVVHVGHSAKNLPQDCRLVVASPAVPADNPELREARRRGIGITKRAVLIGALMDSGRGVAVAGTHGKSTTAGLMAHVLSQAGLNPTFFVGARLPDLGTNARSGGDLLVVEADEYDGSFLHGCPWLAIVTNVEHDHPDCYPTADDVVTAFGAFVARVQADGLVVAWAGSGTTRRVAACSRATVAWYAVAGDDVDADDVDWTATDLSVDGGGHTFEVWHRGDSLGRWSTPLPGRHNVANSLAVIAATQQMDLPLDVVRRAVATFRGAEGRFQVVAETAGITLIDDYAHHPTEIRATLAAARGRYPGRRLWAVVQPHTYSRLRAFEDDFASALAGADRCVVVPVFGAREASPGGAPAKFLAGSIPGAEFAPGLQEAAQVVATGASAGDIVLFLGAGDITAATRAAAGLITSEALEGLVAAAEDSDLSGDVLAEARLKEFTSLRVGGPAGLAARCRSLENLVAWWRLGHRAGVPVLVLGRGSNVLVSDSGFSGLVIINRCEGWDIVDEGDGAMIVAEGGVTLASLAHSLARRGWSALEAAAGIPGSVAAAVITNAGAHGWDMASSLLWAETVDPEGRTRRWSPIDLETRYRGSALKGNRLLLLTRVALRAVRGDPEELAGRMEDYQARRRGTQPTSSSVGSMFKNPEGDFAGRLIEAAGLKGTTVGGAMISDVHANFFINTGEATADDVMALVATASEAVHRRFGVQMDLEIEVIGDGDGI